MSKILIIDDEAGIRTVLSDILEDENYQVFQAEDGYEGLAVLEQEDINLVFLDVWLPNMGGIDVLKNIKQDYPEIEVIIISGHGNIDLAVKAVKLGAFDFLEKPLSLDKILTLTQHALKIESLKKENKALKQSLYMEDEMIGSGPALLKIKEIIKQTASTNVRVLILGENGTGKELVARDIHRRSNRREQPFVELNCAAIPDSLIESELFGHEKGAFTSAIAQKKGKFELAHTGTLFLDEVADMSLNAQAKVLRVIQELTFERIGAEASISVDVRLIAATNKDIQKEIAAKRFREDLYFRLNVVPIFVPPLRERQEDLPALIDYFMQKFKPPAEQEPRTLSKEAFEVLKSYYWPGNIRELKNFIERINIMNDEKVLSVESVRQYLGKESKAATPDLLEETQNMKLVEAKDWFEKKFLLQKLAENKYNISKTAQSIGIYPSNLHGKINKLGIEIKK